VGSVTKIAQLRQRSLAPQKTEAAVGCRHQALRIDMPESIGQVRAYFVGALDVALGDGHDT
jgi:hypothetical protein